MQDGLQALLWRHLDGMHPESGGRRDVVALAVADDQAFIRLHANAGSQLGEVGAVGFGEAHILAVRDECQRIDMMRQASPCQPLQNRALRINGIGGDGHQQLRVQQHFKKRICAIDRRSELAQLQIGSGIEVVQGRRHCFQGQAQAISQTAQNHFGIGKPSITARAGMKDAAPKAGCRALNAKARDKMRLDARLEGSREMPIGVMQQGIIQVEQDAFNHRRFPKLAETVPNPGDRPGSRQRDPLSRRFSSRWLRPIPAA